MTSDEISAKTSLQTAQDSSPLRESLLENALGRKGTRCGPVILDFCQLAGIKREVFIRLDGETYRLCRTRNNKLILTK